MTGSGASDSSCESEGEQEPPMPESGEDDMFS